MELSGIAASEKNEGIYWAQNDEGVPIVYGLNEMGQIVARLQLTGASNLDWEDLSLGPGPKPQVPYLYVGDIGDKGKAAGQVTVYRMEEPQLTPGTLGQSVEASSLLALSLRYPGNAVLDFETLMIDPREGDLYLVQKGGMKVFRARKDALQAATAGTVISLEEVRNTGGWGLEPSSGNFSPSGDEIVLRDEKTDWLFQRQAGQSVADALGKVGLTLTLGPEFNGEAICFDRKGLDLVTLSENTSKDADAPSPPQPISFYPRLAP
jgi:hypothetical protein